MSFQFGSLREFVSDCVNEVYLFCFFFQICDFPPKFLGAFFYYIDFIVIFIFVIILFGNDWAFR